MSDVPMATDAEIRILRLRCEDTIKHCPSSIPEGSKLLARLDAAEAILKRLVDSKNGTYGIFAAQDAARAHLEKGKGGT